MQIIAIAAFILALIALLQPRKRKKILITVVDLPKLEVKKMPIDVGTRDYNTRRRVTIIPVDTAGAPEPVEGAIAATVVEGDITIERVSDNVIDIVPGNLFIGNFTVQLGADADPDPAVEDPIKETIVGAFTHPKASQLTATVEDLPK